MKNFVLNAARLDENMEQSYQWYLQGVCRIRAFLRKSIKPVSIDLKSPAQIYFYPLD